MSLAGNSNFNQLLDLASDKENLRIDNVGKKEVEPLPTKEEI